MRYVVWLTKPAITRKKNPQATSLYYALYGAGQLVLKESDMSEHYAQGDPGLLSRGALDSHIVSGRVSVILHAIYLVWGTVSLLQPWREDQRVGCLRLTNFDFFLGGGGCTMYMYPQQSPSSATAVICLRLQCPTAHPSILEKQRSLLDNFLQVEATCTEVLETHFKLPSRG